MKQSSSTTFLRCESWAIAAVILLCAGLLLGCGEKTDAQSEETAASSAEQTTDITGDQTEESAAEQEASSSAVEETLEPAAETQAGIPVPNVVGMLLQDALSKLRAAKLQVTFSQVAAPDVADEHVVSQDPVEGALIAEEGMVVLQVAQRPPPPPEAPTVQVPDVLGLNVDGARRVLTALKLGVTSVKHTPSSKPEGKIIVQSPEKGSSVKEGSTVALEVAAVPKVQVPDVTGIEYRAAVRMLGSHKLKVTSVKQIASSKPKGQVIAQRPRKGASVKEGSSVALTVAKPPVVRAKTYSLVGGRSHVNGGGGGGGSAFSNYCPSGYVAVGLAGRSGIYMDRVQLLCRRLNANGTLGAVNALPARGGGGGGAYKHYCASRQVLVGLFGRSGSFVDQLGGRCKSVSKVVGRSGSSSNIGPRGGKGGSYFSRGCPSGHVVVGISGRSGKYLDRIGFYCRRLQYK